ncbi:MAG: hypothetical protein IPG64_16605 [Haliea sp.]|nr:hypothetical protein [Haliea sp.]
MSETFPRCNSAFFNWLLSFFVRPSGNILWTTNSEDPDTLQFAGKPTPMPNPEHRFVTPYIASKTSAIFSSSMRPFPEATPNSAKRYSDHESWYVDPWRK